MILCENSRVFAAIFLALTEMDAWPVLVNARLSAQEVDPDSRALRRAEIALYGGCVATGDEACEAARRGDLGQ